MKCLRRTQRTHACYITGTVPPRPKPTWWWCHHGDVTLLTSPSWQVQKWPLLPWNQRLVFWLCDYYQEVFHNGATAFIFCCKEKHAFHDTSNLLEWPNQHYLSYAMWCPLMSTPVWFLDSWHLTQYTYTYHLPPNLQYMSISLSPIMIQIWVQLSTGRKTWAAHLKIG